jgi:hypothetical protein
LEAELSERALEAGRERARVLGAEPAAVEDQRGELGNSLEQHDHALHALAVVA